MPSSSNLPQGGLLTDKNYKLDYSSKSFLGCSLFCWARNPSKAIISHLSARYDFSLRSGLNRTSSTANGASEKKIVSGAKKPTVSLTLSGSRSAGANECSVVGLGGGIGSSEISLVRGTPITPLSLSTVILPNWLRFEQELGRG